MSHKSGRLNGPRQTDTTSDGACSLSRTSRGTGRKIFQVLETDVYAVYYMSAGCYKPLSLLEFQFMTEEDHLVLWKAGYADYKTNGGWKGLKDRARVFIYV